MERATFGPIVEAVIAALGGSGSSAIAGHLDEETLLHMPGGSGLAGDYQGREAICGLMDRLATNTRGTLRFETVCTGARGRDHVWLQGRICGYRLEHSLQTSASLEVTVADDSVREVWLACSDQVAWDDFWS